MKFYKRILLLMVLFLCYTSICAFSYATVVFDDISDSVFRLHIIANSDSKEDQDLKLLVRDNVLKYMKEISTDVSSKEEVISLMENHLDDFKNIAISTIRDNGFDYDVNLRIGKFDFPTKTYGDISLPSGMYDALRIEIGDAIGQNWWCVMFPTLCFVDVSSGSLDNNSKAVLEGSLNEEGFNLVSENNSKSKFKFKIVEFFEDIRITLAEL